MERVVSALRISSNTKVIQILNDTIKKKITRVIIKPFLLIFSMGVSRTFTFGIRI
jgi:hypothetical protein